MTVEEILNKLEIPYKEVNLGEAILTRDLESKERLQLEKEFAKVGFEILQGRNEKLISNIKSVIIENVYSGEVSTEKLSSILTSKLNYDYSHITHVFTESEGQSIQKFYNAVRIERAKELMDYDDWSIAMIADNLGYSTPAYLSTSFKNATSLSPSEYRKRAEKDRKNLDSI